MSNGEFEIKKLIYNKREKKNLNWTQVMRLGLPCRKANM
jgi:hypothetical protein